MAATYCGCGLGSDGPNMLGQHFHSKIKMVRTVMEAGNERRKPQTPIVIPLCVVLVAGERMVRVAALDCN